jgi:coatomer protein complex subunit alpha (xenin)
LLVSLLVCLLLPPLQMLPEDGVPQLPQKTSLQLPPAPILKQDNWPLLTISKGFFETLAAGKGAAAGGAAAGAAGAAAGAAAAAGMDLDENELEGAGWGDELDLGGGGGAEACDEDGLAGRAWLMLAFSLNHL